MREPVLPGAAGLRELALDRTDVDLLCRPLRRRHDVMHAGQHGLAELGREVGDAALKGVLEDLGEALAQLGVVALARHIDEAGGEAAEGVAAHEQRDTLPLLQIEDAERGVVELVVRDLQELVARICVENVQQRLGVMALGREARALQRPADLAAKQRNRSWIAAVGERGEETHEEPLAHHAAVQSEQAHADRVHMRRAVHGGALVRLGDREDARQAQEILHLDGQRLEAPQPVEDRVLAVAEDAEGAAGDDTDVEPVTLGLEAVLAETQKGEVVVLEPSQKLRGLGDLLGRQRQARCLQHALAHGLEPLDHRLPIRHRRAHVHEHVLESGGDLGEPLRISLLARLYVHGGFPEHRRGTVAAGAVNALGIEQLHQLSLGVPSHPQDRVDH
jgi:hypothetical protein